MKFSPFMFAVGAAAVSIEIRDLTSIKSTLTNVRNSVDRLTAACKTFTGAPQEGVNAVNNLIKSINDGIVTANASGTLSLVDTLTLRPVVTSLRDSARNLDLAYLDVIPLISQYHLCDLSRCLIGKINNGTDSLIDTLNSKVPLAAQKEAKPVADEIKTILAAAVASVTTDKCTQTCSDKEMCSKLCSND
ncbi:hypothetical protein NLG97_g2021 [Lecanicillium saksenae]|uniref:Uncharacterized protein n=1 Tax=Lecanicillium saksenae TaxID=468837 RepID=A0ACC1R266_9HYPO|nr:hypothetical protein NLG97_g2021 [Lecanicillium saksenae]